MYEEEENKTAFCLIALIGISVCLSKFEYDPWQNWLYEQWVQLCNTVYILGLASLYLVLFILGVGLALGAIYLLYRALGYFYRITWGQIRTNHENICLIDRERLRSKDDLETLECQVSSLRAKQQKDTIELKRLTQKLKDFTGLTAQEEAEKAQASFKEKKSGGMYEQTQTPD